MKEEKRRFEFGLDQICPSCKGKGRKNKHECWSCGGTGITRRDTETERRGRVNDDTT